MHAMPAQAKHIYTRENTGGKVQSEMYKQCEICLQMVSREGCVTTLGKLFTPVCAEADSRRQWVLKQGIAPARRYAPRRWQFDGGKNRGGSTSVRGRVR